ncbi:hypothetical protein ACFWGD_09750 [Corynebacterium sp. NPDC060344]|uniref:hypothetical protein n=1 Tax=Corynebacterium sp. NPDC060344 TaxID=3347101 RepID=UPI003655EAFE
MNTPARTVSLVASAAAIIIAIVFGFFVDDDALYHWWASGILGVIALVAAIRAKSIGLGVLAVVAAFSPAILMFGSWLIFTAYHMISGTTPA